MAKQQKENEKKVTRISASDSKGSKKLVQAAKVKADVAGAEPAAGKGNIINRFFAYFKGAWYELRQVRWPDRRATWSLTGAVLAFTAFFVLFILLLDALFKYIFEFILK